ncbi:tape measure protein [Rhizobium sp. Rhizsp82]|uniref:tape measure protein n=1 Tax=Rhizobium sp. Rhizsp82 TaxID=3243057 RepID=UPI0039B3D1A7
MAAQDLERLVVQLSADITKFDRAMARASGTANTRMKAIERRAVAMNKNLSSSLTGFGTALAGAFTVKGVTDFLDSFTKIQNSLKVAGLSGKELDTVYNQLYASAQKNAAPLEALATLYGRVAINQKELGVSSEQVSGLADTVAKALKAQGSTAEEASGALLQLSQALGSSKVQSEEWGSLLDGMPVLLQAAAAGIEQAGGSVSKLTQLVKSGKLSNKALFDGIAAGASVIDQKLAGSAETSSQSLNKINNALTNSVGRFGTAANASAAFGNVVDQIVRYLDNVNFDHLAQEVAHIVEILNTATGAVTGFLAKASEAAGIDVSKIANSIVPKAGESSGDYWYRALYGTSRAADMLKENAEQRLEIEKKINEYQTSPLKDSPLVKREIAMEQARMAALTAGTRFEQPQRPISPTPKRPVQGPNKPAFVAPKVNIEDEKYKPIGGSSGSGRKRLDEYAREVKQITERTAALNAQTAAQAELNPYVNDFGYNVEKASTAQDLLTAAQNAGTAAGKELKDVQQLLSGKFDDLSPKAKEQAVAMLALASGAGEAVANQERLADAQDKLRQNMEDWRDVSKDATKGFIQDLVEGKSAADALAGALQKLGNKLLDLAIDGLFGTSGSNNWFPSLFSNGASIPGFATGTRSAPGGLALVGERGPELVNLPKGSQVMPTLPSMKALNGGAAGSSQSFTFAPVIDARGADVAAVARLERVVAKQQAEFSANVLKTVNRGNRRRLLD